MSYIKALCEIAQTDVRPPLAFRQATPEERQSARFIGRIFVWANYALWSLALATLVFARLGGHESAYNWAKNTAKGLYREKPPAPKPHRANPDDSPERAWS